MHNFVIIHTYYLSAAYGRTWLALLNSQFACHALVSLKLQTPTTLAVIAMAITHTTIAHRRYPLVLYNAIALFETCGEFLLVLVLGVGGEEYAGGGALEGLEARFALDGLGGIVLGRGQ